MEIGSGVEERKIKEKNEIESKKREICSIALKFAIKEKKKIYKNNNKKFLLPN